MSGAGDYYRRILLQPSMLLFDQETRQVIRPTSAAFKIHPAEDGLSVNDAALMRQADVPVSRLADHAASAAVAGLSTAAISEQGLTVQADPQSTPKDLGPSHALIVGWKRLSRSRQSRVSSNLAKASDCAFPQGPWSAIRMPDA